MEAVMEIIRAIRNIRGEMDVPPGKQIGAVLDCRSEAAVAIVQAGETYLRVLARVGDLSYGVGMARPEQAATLVAGEVEILLPLSGMINLEEEEKRLQKEVAKVEKDVAMFAKKLSNEAFVAKAPPEVLEKDRGKLREAEEKLQILQQSLSRILGLSQGGLASRRFSATPKGGSSRVRPLAFQPPRPCWRLRSSWLKCACSLRIASLHQLQMP
jgi:valyl-tRNA synthetase